jgi:hypothetical protein
VKQQLTTLFNSKKNQITNQFTRGVYRQWDTNKLIRFKYFLYFTGFEVLNKNLNKIYKFSGNVLGNKNVNKLIDITYGDIFIGGSNEKTLKVSMNKLKEQNLNSIADYALEFLNDGEEHKVPEIIQSFKNCIDTASVVDKDNMIAMKISSLTPISFMKFANDLQHFLKIIQNNKNQSYAEVMEKLEVYDLTKYAKFDEISFKEYKKLLGKVFNNQILKLHQNATQNGSDAYKFNLFELICNCDVNETNQLKSILGNIFNINEHEISNLVERSIKLEKDCRNIFDYAKDLKTKDESSNISVMIDAEQTYIQVIIDYMLPYYMNIYNKNDICLLLQTFQMYLKNSNEKIEEFTKFCKENTICNGAKVVRGAYMNEERKIAELKKYPSPICEDQQMTYIMSLIILDLMISLFLQLIMLIHYL